MGKGMGKGTGKGLNYARCLFINFDLHPIDDFDEDDENGYAEGGDKGELAAGCSVGALMVLPVAADPNHESGD